MGIETFQLWLLQIHYANITLAIYKCCDLESIFQNSIFRYQYYSVIINTLSHDRFTVINQYYLINCQFILHQWCWSHFSKPWGVTIWNIWQYILFIPFLYKLSLNERFIIKYIFLPFFWYRCLVFYAKMILSCFNGNGDLRKTSEE